MYVCIYNYVYIVTITSDEKSRDMSLFSTQFLLSWSCLVLFLLLYILVLNLSVLVLVVEGMCLEFSRHILYVLTFHAFVYFRKTN